ncbi:hypothetical protein ACUL41_03625 [Virgibacillus natechei]
MKIRGLDNFEKKINQLEKNAKQIDGDNNIPFDEIFNPSFMTKYTQYTSIHSFFEDSPFTLETQEDLKAIPEDELDLFISQNTNFNSWQNMLSEAGKQWTVKQLGF